MDSTFSLGVPLGIGTMFWGDTPLDEKMAGRIIPDSTLIRIREITAEREITFFDTAEGYGFGSSEKRLARLGFTGPSTFVATKFLPTLWRWSPQSFVRATRASNQRLGVERCPVSFIHSPIHPRSPKTWIRGAARAAREGILEMLGVSNFDAEQVRAAWEVARDEGIPLVANQLMFSLLVYRSAQLQETVQACRELGIAVIGYGALGQGLLTSNLSPERFAVNRLAHRMQLTYEALAPLRAAVHEIAERHRKSMAQVCLQWVRAKEVIPLVGTRSAEQLEDTLGALDFSLTGEETATLDSLSLASSTFDRPLWRRALFVAFLSLLFPAVQIGRAVRGRL